MIASLLLLAAQAASLATQGAQRDCVRAVGSEIAVCGAPAQSDEASPPQTAPLPQATYRPLNFRPRSYGPPSAAQAEPGHRVRATLRGHAINSRKGRKTRPVATLSVPF